MRTLFTLLFLVFPFVCVYNQTTVEFKYSKTGSRTSRKTTTINLKSTSNLSSDSFSKEKKNTTESFTEELGDYNVLIYPNPVESEINISIEGKTNVSLVEISIYDQAGRLVLKRNESSDKILINLSHLTPGSYYMNLFLDGKNKKWTIVKD